MFATVVVGGPCQPPEDNVSKDGVHDALLVGSTLGSGIVLMRGALGQAIRLAIGVGEARLEDGRERSVAAQDVVDGAERCCGSCRTPRRGANSGSCQRPIQSGQDSNEKQCAGSHKELCTACTHTRSDGVTLVIASSSSPGSTVVEGSCAE